MNIWDPQLLINGWYIIAIFYIFWCWLLPILGMTNNIWAAGNSKRYWEGVRFLSFAMHLSIVGTGLLIWGLEEYIFVQSVI